MTRSWRNHKQCATGATLVEYVLGLSILLVALMGVSNFLGGAFERRGSQSLDAASQPQGATPLYTGTPLGPMGPCTDGRGFLSPEECI